MSGITQAQAQAKLDALMAANTSQSLTVRYAERLVTYREASEITALINYWSRILAALERAAAGRSRHGFALADLR